MLIISADADSLKINDSIKNILAASFSVSGLPIETMGICDRRNEEVVSRIF